MKLPKQIVDFYFNNHPDMNPHLYLDHNYDDSVDIFYANFDKFVREFYPDASQNYIDRLVDELYE